MKLVDSGKLRYEDASERATSWVAEREDNDGVVGLATKLYARDRDAFASVLGSAIALRLFLFVIAANVALLGLSNMLNIWSLIGEALEASPTTGTMASSYDDISFWHSVWVTLTGVVFTLWSGRSLARVLATCSTAAWQMHARASRLGIKSILALSGLIVALLLSSLAFARMRDLGGVAVSFTAWLAVAASAMAGWFLVQLVLPRATTDPGAVLPGAALLGIGFSVLQWFMQIYLPGKIERTTDTYGSMASTVAALGYFFFVGRLMSASFVVNAVVFERWGSISQFVFGLPVIRRIPQRYPRVHAFFDLGPHEPSESTVPIAPAEILEQLASASDRHGDGEGVTEVQ